MFVLSVWSSDLMLQESTAIPHILIITPINQLIQNALHPSLCPVCIYFSDKLQVRMRDLICVMWLQMSTFKDMVRWCISNTHCLGWFVCENDIQHPELSLLADKTGQYK